MQAILADWRDAERRAAAAVPGSAEAAEAERSSPVSATSTAGPTRPPARSSPLVAHRELAPGRSAHSGGRYDA